MPKLYVANTTVQFRDFMALKPETGGMIRQKIRPGHQAVVFEGTLNEIDHIIRQNEIYGLILEDHIKNAEEFIGMVYQIDRKIKTDTFGIADEKNHAHMIEFGTETREKVANYAQASILNTMQQAGEESKSMEIEIKDVSKDPTFHEVFSPAPPKDAASAKPRARKRK